MRSRLARAVFGAIGIAALPLGAEPSFTGVGFSAGGNNTVAYGVSADGSAVVGVGSATLDPETFLYVLDLAFRWTESGGMVSLGDLPGGDVFAQLGCGLVALSVLDRRRAGRKRRRSLI